MFFTVKYRNFAYLLFSSFSYAGALYSNNGSYDVDKEITLAIKTIATEYLNDYQLVIMAKHSLRSMVLFEALAESIFESERNIYLYTITPESSYEDVTYPPENIQRSLSACILILEDNSSWIEEEEIPFGYFTTLVIKLNPSKESNILTSPFLQRSPYLTMIEASTGTQSTKLMVYTFLPYFRDANGDSKSQFFLGEWSRQRFPTTKSLFPERFDNLNGEVLSIATDLDDYPLIYVTDEDQPDGTNIRIVNTIGEYLNFSAVFTKKAPDGYWGEKVNGTWNGLLGMVIYDDYNFTINYFGLVLDRSKEFDYSTFYFFEGFGFALQLPPPLPAWMSLIYPFAWEVWASVSIFIFFVAFVLYSLHAWIPWIEDSSPILTAHLYTFQSLMKQSLNKIPEETGSRLVLAFWWIGGLVFTVSYTGNLIAVLTVPVFPEKIRTLAKLAESDIRVAMVDYGEFVPDALLASKDKHLNKLGQKMDLLTMYDDDELTYNNLVDELLDGKHAIVETYSYLRNLVTDHEVASSQSYFLREQIYSGSLVFYFKKFTPWLPRFNNAVTRLFEAGIVNKWYKDIMGNEEDGNIETSNDPKSLTLYHLQGPFILLLVGNVFAIVLFLVEMVVQKFN